MTTYTSLLLKTGQTTLYNAGDDGDLEKGSARSLTLLAAGQYSGTTNIVLNAQTDVHTNNCVQDNTTGLMWSAGASASVGPDGGKGHVGLLPWTVNVDGEGIFEYAAAANAANLAGHDDWRIPNIIELQSLFNYGTGWPAEISYFFGNIWSSTTTPTDATNAYYFNVASGVSYSDGLKTDPFFKTALLVRGDPAAPAPAVPCPTDLNFEINGLLDVTVYLQAIRDAILGVTPKTPGLLTWEIYLQEIRDAILLMYP